MNYRKRFTVPSTAKIDLTKIDPDSTAEFKSKKHALAKLNENTKLLTELQYKLYAESKQSLLIVLQAMDAAGKDGTINHVMAPMNPQGCRVCGFKAPSTEERAHDFLWRIHKQTPKNGEIVIFNRSHYEDVLVARVHDLVPKKIWSRRYEFINDFEKMLVAHNTKIVKFYLHIDKQEQLSRFMKRLDIPEKQWKISDSDYSERAYWEQYREAFEEALSRCSTKHAPWYVIPANHKWFRNLAVSEILVETLKSMRMRIPEPSVDLDEIRKLAEKETR
ncbi:MAG: polyphosphate kinase 2 family protein [Kiritimatiellaeota bacterium]|nr:polyphosphate kinase 2 family protein [Kiritimatiellota bacterium]